MSYGSILQLTSAESVSHTAFNLVDWDQEYLIDGPTWYSGGTPSRLTVPTGCDGMYGEVIFVARGFGVGSMRIELLKNGSVFTTMWSNRFSGNQHHFNIRTGVIQYVAGDYWEVNIRTDTQSGSSINSNESQLAAVTYERQGFTLATPPSGFTFNGNFGVSTWHATHDDLNTIDPGLTSFTAPPGAKAVIANGTAHHGNIANNSYWYLFVEGTRYGLANLSGPNPFENGMGPGVFAVAPCSPGDTIQPIYVGSADSPGGFDQIELSLEWIRAGTAQGLTAFGTGALVQPAGLLAGTGTNLGTITGTGALIQPTQALSGTGLLAISGSGALTNPSAALSGVGSVGGQHVGSGALQQPLGALSGSGQRLTSGQGNLTQPAGGLAGTGERIVTGFGEFTTSSNITVVESHQVDDLTESPVVTLNFSTSLQENDIVIVSREGDFPTVPIPNGYRQLRGFEDMYKRMGPTPDTSVDIPTLSAPGLGFVGAAVVYVFRDVSQTSVLDVEYQHYVHPLTTGSANPPAITPDADDCLIYAVGRKPAFATRCTVAPTNYSNLQSGKDNNSGGGALAAATRLLSGGGGSPEDPGSFGFGAITGAANATTFAIRARKAESGGIAQPAGVLSGVGQNVDIAGSGALIQPTQALSGSGTLTRSGSGALIQPTQALSGSGTVITSVVNSVGFRIADPSSGLDVTSTESTITFDLEDIDTNNGANAATGEFTVPASMNGATMIFSAGLRHSGADVNLELHIEKNDGSWGKIASQSIDNSLGLTVRTGPETLSTGDIYRVRMWAQATRTLSECYFGGWAP